MTRVLVYRFANYILSYHMRSQDKITSTAYYVGTQRLKESIKSRPAAFKYALLNTRLPWKQSFTLQRVCMCLCYKLRYIALRGDINGVHYTNEIQYISAISIK